MTTSPSARDARLTAIPERLTRTARVGWAPDPRDRGFLAYLALFCAALLGIELAGLQGMPAVGGHWWVTRHADTIALVCVAAVAVLPALRTGQRVAVVVLDDTVARVAWPWPLPREYAWRPAVTASLRRHLVGGLVAGLVVGLVSWSLLGAGVAGVLALGTLTASGALGHWAVRARRQVARTGMPAWVGKMRWGPGLCWRSVAVWGSRCSDYRPSSAVSPRTSRRSA